MPEILLAFALTLPCEVHKDYCWVGWRSFTVGLRNGFTLKTVVWPNSVIIEYGVFNQMAGSFRVW